MISLEKDLKKMKLGDILDYTLSLYKQCFKDIIKPSFFFQFPISLILSMLISFTTYKSIDDIERSSMQGIFPVSIFYLIGMILMASIIYAVYTLLLSSVKEASISKIIFDRAVKNRRITLKESFEASFKSYGSLVLNKLFYSLFFIGFIIIAYIAVIFLTFVIALAIAAIAFRISSGQFITGIALAILIGLIILAAIVALIMTTSYFNARFSLGIPIIINEGRSGSAAVSRGFILTARTFFHTSISQIVIYLFYAIFPMITAWLINLGDVAGGPYIILTSIVSSAITALVQPIIITYYTVLLIDMKISKEGFDLEARIDRMFEARDQQNFHEAVEE